MGVDAADWTSVVDVSDRASRLVGQVTNLSVFSWVNILPLAARTAQADSLLAAIPTGARGVIVNLRVTVASGVGGLTLRLLGGNPGGAGVTNPAWNPARVPAITTVGDRFMVLLYPGIQEGEITIPGGFIQRVAMPLISANGSGLAAEIDVGDASSYTYQVDRLFLG
jgi:hypothetical protein